MNRVGKYDWKKYKTPTEDIKNSGFDAYTYPNAPYKKTEKYLNNRDHSDSKIERMIECTLPIYKGEEEDNIDGRVLYYSPKAQAALHKKIL